MLPSLNELELVRKKVKNIPNRQGEYKRKIHYGCYLLCSKSGLRISEAIKFDLSAQTKRGLYRITKPKGKKEWFVYIPQQVIRELKKNNWKPNQTNRHNFYHFLRKIKRELGISKNTELTPHTLRRSFTTYHAESGMPLPLLQKLLGHASIRTTALYWHNIYQEPFKGKVPINDADILAVKKWLEKRETPKPPSTENFLLKSSEISIIRDKLTILAQTHLPPLISIEPKPTIANYQPEPLISKIPIKNQEKFFNQPPALTAKEKLLLAKIKNLEEQLAQVQVENKHLKTLIQQDQKTETKIIQQLPFK